MMTVERQERERGRKGEGTNNLYVPLLSESRISNRHISDTKVATFSKNFLLFLLFLSLLFTLLFSNLPSFCSTNNKNNNDNKNTLLQSQIEHLIQSKGGFGSWSVAFNVINIHNNNNNIDLLVDIHAHVLQSPASNVKLFTSAAIYNQFILNNNNNVNNNNTLETSVFAKIVSENQNYIDVVIIIRGGNLFNFFSL